MKSNLPTKIITATAGRRHSKAPDEGLVNFEVDLEETAVKATV